MGFFKGIKKEEFGLIMRGEWSEMQERSDNSLFFFLGLCGGEVSKVSFLSHYFSTSICVVGMALFGV